MTGSRWVLAKRYANPSKSVTTRSGREAPRQVDAAPPVGRHAAQALASVRPERPPGVHLTVLERELEAPDLLDVREELAEVRERAARGRDLDLVALPQEVLGDDARARRVPQTLADDAVQDFDRSPSPRLGPDACKANGIV